MKASGRNRLDWISLEGWVRDFRTAARSLRRNPAFTIAVFCSLLLCIGPNTAILAALYALVVKPLPFPEPQELVTVLNVAEKNAGQVLQSSLSQYEEFKAHADQFENFTAFRSSAAMLETGAEWQRVARLLVTPEFFDVLGVAPRHGRFFRAEEATAGRDNVVVLSEEFWAAHFGSDPDVVGKQIQLEGQPHTVVGVAPRRVAALHHPTHIYQPYAAARARFDAQLRYRGDVTLYGRLKPGVSPPSGLAQLRGLEAEFQTRRAPAQIKAYAETAGFRVHLEPLRHGGVGAETVARFWLLQASALAILLVGCVNVTNLFLARLNARRMELAVRVSLGASKAALRRQLVAESLLLTLTATAAGSALAVAAVRVFNRYLPALAPGAAPIGFDPAVALLAFMGAVVLAISVSVLPFQLHAGGGLRLSSSRNASAGRGARAVSRALASAQVAVAVVLLVGAGLLLRSFVNVLANDPGFDAVQLVHARSQLPRHYAPTVPLVQRYQDPQAAANVALQRRLVEALRAIPGVEQAALTLDPIIDPHLRPVPFATRGAEAAGGEGQALIHIAAVSPEFFETLGVRVMSGRGFRPDDDFSRAPVAVVDEAFAQRYFPASIVEGQEIHLSKGLPLTDESWTRIVGVVTRARFTGMDSRDDLPMVFVPLVGFPLNGFSVVVRSARPADVVIREMATAFREVDSAVPLYNAEPLRVTLDRLLSGRRGITLLLVAFAVMALMLAAIGLYGVLAYDVTQRAREIGIRGAIGATPRQVVALILREGAVQCGVGLGVGVGAAVFAGRYAEALLFHVTGFDPMTYVAVVALLGATGFVACWLPARQAAKVDPIQALKAE